MKRFLALLGALSFLAVGAGEALASPIVVRMGDAKRADPTVSEALRASGADRSFAAKIELFQNDELAVKLPQRVVNRDVWIAQEPAGEKPASSVFEALQAVDASHSNFAAGVHVVLDAQTRARYGDEFLSTLFGAVDTKSLQFAGGGAVAVSEAAPVPSPRADSASSVPLIWGGASHPELARELAQRLGLPEEQLSSAPEQAFQRAQLPSDPVGRSVVLVQSKRRGASELFHQDLLETLHGAWEAKRAGATSVTLVSPYLPYSRSDRIDGPGGTIGVAVLAQLLKRAGVDKIVFYSVHQPQELGLFQALHMQVAQVSGEELLASRMAKYVGQSGHTDDLAVLAPDAGAAKRARVFAHALERHLGLAPNQLPLFVASKTRLGNATSLKFDGDVRGKLGIVIDDETASGGTLSELAEAAHDNGATGILGAVSHLTGAAGKVLDGSQLDRLFVLDTLPQPKAQLGSKVEVVSIAPQLARVMKGLSTGRGLEKLLFYEHAR